MRYRQFRRDSSDYFGHMMQVFWGQNDQRLKLSENGKKVLQTRLRTVFEQICE
jgi:hypothetical protein